MSYILGINCFHADSSACLLKDGKMVAAVEEERFRRVKHWAGFPLLSVKYLLRNEHIDLHDIDIIAINQNERSNLLFKALYVFTNGPSLRFIYSKLRIKRKRSGIQEILKREFPNSKFRGKLFKIDHHKAHLASAFFVSPFTESVVLSVDGFGDFASTAWGIGRQTKLEVHEKILFPHSLGIFYQALTQYLGFPNYGDEYKVMGLAPYGKPKFVDKLRELIILKTNGKFELNLIYFAHHTQAVNFTWEDGNPFFGNLFSSKLKELLGLDPRSPQDELLQEHMDLARSVQEVYEESLFHILNSIYDSYGIDSLALAGGCAMNSVANGKIRSNTPFKNIYIQSAAGDAGGAVGAAFTVWHQEYKVGKSERTDFHNHAYWGPSFTNSYIKNILEPLAHSNSNLSIRFKDDFTCIADDVAKAISEGKVIGWFQGAMEWGPRALGNRSILCDPRRSDMKDILNIKIKRRESFRPFAPSILMEHTSEWFEETDDVPFMMKVFKIRKSKHKLIPAVTHIDGSGRLQTVSEKTNRRYYNLIKAFYEITGVPILLNTSFNENEPVVCTPEEAVQTFLRTKMDLLVMENWIICRS